MRYSHFNPKTTDRSSFGLAGGPHGGGFQGTGSQGTHNGAINYTRVFSPTLLTEPRFGVNRYRNDAQQFDYGTDATRNLGVPGVNRVTRFLSSGQWVSTLSAFRIPSLAIRRHALDPCGNQYRPGE